MLTMFNIHTSTAGTLTMYRNSVNLRHFYKHVIKHLRDRPFNLQGGYGFLFRSEICFRTSRVRKKKLLRAARIFFPELNIRLYDKNSESNYFIFLHQNQNIFFSKKNINTPPPLEIKWSVPYLNTV